MAIDIKGMFGNNDEFDDAKKLKTYIMDLAEIDTNENNVFAEMNEDEINTKLASSIEELGLIEPLRVILKNGRYVLQSGERRYRAMCYLSDNDRHYSYNGVDITGKAPVNVSQVDEKNEMLELISANASRDLSKEDKETIVKVTITILKQKIEFGELNEKEIGSKAQWLSQETGYSEHFCKDCLAKYNREEKEAETNPMATTEEPEEKEVDEKKELKKYGKNLCKFAEKMEGVDIEEILNGEFIDDEDIQTFKLSYNKIAEQVLYLQKVIQKYKSK